jgi:hypothetical protein
MTKNRNDPISSVHRYRKAKNRLLLCCYVATTSAAQNRLLFYLFFCCGCLQYYEANKASLKQSIILRCLCFCHVTQGCQGSQGKLLHVAVAGIIVLVFSNVNMTQIIRDGGV